jgi:hypothetical protein
MQDFTLQSTLEAKLAYERAALTYGVKVQGYWADNGRFADTGWKEACENEHQRFDYCGVGAHHQNGIAERKIRTLSQGARASLLHASQRWPAAVFANLWPYALQHDCMIHNKVRVRLDRDLKTAEELFSGTERQVELTDLHPFGCPVYVLDSKLQSGNGSIPRWEPRSRVGVYLGHSSEHAGSVALVLNLTTGHVSPQFHCVFDDDFTTVEHLRLGTIPTNWEELYSNQRELATEEHFSLAPEWSVDSVEIPAENTGASYLQRHLWETQPVSVAEQNEGAIAPDMPSNEGDMVRHSSLPNFNFDHDRELGPIIDSEANLLLLPPPVNFAEAGLRRSARLKNKRLQHGTSIGALLSMTTIKRTMSFAAVQLQGFELKRINKDGTYNEIHPFAFAATLSDSETFHYGDAMKQPDKILFLKAMVKEVDDLTTAGIWVIRRREDIGQRNLIRAIWSFKRKRAPDGTYLKHKARLCAHGGMQQYGEHYWDTYSPVVQMMTVRLLLVLALILDLHTRSIDFTLAYTQAPIDVETFIEIPTGFDIDGNRHDFVLELKKNLYGLKQAGLNWFETFKTHLLLQGFRQSAVDPCCFIKGDLVLLAYVDDCLIFCNNKGHVDTFLRELQEAFTLTDEGDVATYLGMNITKNKGGTEFTLSQPHLIDRIIQSVNLHDMRLHDTPAEPKTLLTKDIEGDHRKTFWSYRGVVGMLNYLCGTRPELLFAVHQCARFGVDPKLSHERAIQRIIRYLKRTPKDGIILRPDTTRGLQCYVDADFAGSWSSADADDVSSVYSRTGYVIMYAGCPIIWVSNLQTEIALSTTEAEYIALSQAMRDVIPFVGLVEELSSVFHLVSETPTVQWKACGLTEDGKFAIDVYEDNRGAYELARAPKMRPRTKHIALKYHHFRKHVEDGTIRINTIGTKDQVADIFTKALERDLFISLRKLLSGW